MAVSAISPQMTDPAKRPPVNSRRESIAVPQKVAILGFGTVGKAVAELLCRNPLPGLRLTHVFNRNVERKRVSWVPENVEWTSDLKQVFASDVDVVLELVGGIEPAKEWVQQALLSGKSVVTANKHLMAVHGLELLQLARQSGQRILYGASVAGGVPVLHALEQGLAGDRLVKFAGVLNGTCNYILSNMESHGTPFAKALARVQKLGFAEADPSDDVNGVDASCKLAIVARMGLQADIRPESVYRQSILGIEPIDFECARQLGCTIRQVSMAEIRGKSLLAAVQPMLVPLSSPLSRTKDNQNALVVAGKHGGETVFSGRGAGGGPTAVAVVSDLLVLAQNTRFAPPRALQSYRVSSDFSLAYMVRVKLTKQSIAELRKSFSRNGLEFQSVLPKPKRSKSPNDVAVTVKPCRPKEIEKAVRELCRSQVSRNVPIYLPLLPDQER
jgi:homoserine dehydrogenase